MDVLEIDAATHTGIDNVREVIIAGLAIVPVRDRYKVFIIDEVHQLSTPSFKRAAEVDRGAAAARRLHDGDDRAAQDPETVLSRSQVFEFKTISARVIAGTLRAIAGAEQIAVAARRCCSSPARPRAACATPRARSTR